MITITIIVIIIESNNDRLAQLLMAQLISCAGSVRIRQSCLKPLAPAWCS